MWLKEFKEKFTEDFLSLHWRQWSALGFFTHEKTEEKWVIDPEALIISTLSLRGEKRLLEGCKQWCEKNRAWISTSRLRRIAREFSKPQPRVKRTPLSQNLRILQDFLKGKGKKPEKEVISQPSLNSPSLLLLKLRAMFGPEARSGIFLCFLLGMRGNSYEIAEMVHYDQKRVYQVLKAWEKAGLLESSQGGREKKYWLSHGEIWKEILGLKALPPFLNWPRIFLLLHRINLALREEIWQNPYLLSSLFKDIYSDVRGAFQPLGMRFPKPEDFPGEEYFLPFSQALLDALTRLKG